MKVRVFGVSIPAMSTIGRGVGDELDDGGEVTGRVVTFAGDHRPMWHLGYAIEAASERGALPVIDLEDWQVLSSLEAAV